MQRVTTLGSNNLSAEWLRTSSARIAEGQREISTGIRVDRASQAPSESAGLLRNQRSLDRIAQLDRNSTNAKLWLSTADGALTDSVGVLTRARTLAIQGANDTNSPEARAAIAADLREIRRDLLALANTQVNGRPLFAGTAGGPAAYDTAGDFVGDDGRVVRAVTTTDSFAVAATGPEVFGAATPGDPYNGSVFQVLERMAQAVESGDVAGIREGMEATDVAMSRIQSEIGRVGGMTGRLEDIDARNASQRIAVQDQISQVRDVEMTDAIIRLRSAETSHEATLSAVGRSLSRSLLDFLR